MKPTSWRSWQPNLKTLQKLTNSAFWQLNLCTSWRHTTETSFDVLFKICLRRCKNSKDKHITIWDYRDEVLDKTAPKIMHKNEKGDERGKKIKTLCVAMLFQN